MYHEPVATIWGLIPIEDDEADDEGWRRTHGLNQDNEFPTWQPESE